MGLKRELVAMLKECAEHDLEIWRYKCIEWLLRECIKMLINEMEYFTRRWKTALDVIWREDDLHTGHHHGLLDNGTEALAVLKRAAGQLDIQPFVEDFLKNIVMANSSQGFDAIDKLKECVLELCPYEDIMAAFEENRGEGFLISPVVRNRQLKVGRYLNAEDAFEAHYPY